MSNGILGTKGLIGYLKNLQARITQEQFTLTIDDMEAKINLWMRRIVAIPPGNDRLVFVYEALERVAQIDRESRKNDPKGSLWNRVKCKKGCAACCGMLVNVSVSEARALAALVNDGRVKVDRGRLERQTAKRHDAVTWWELGAKDRECVFLKEDRTCGVYEDRPTECRTYLVLSDPALCAGPAGTNVAVFTCLDVEIVKSAYYNVESVSMSLPLGVLSRLRPQKEKS